MFPFIFSVKLNVLGFCHERINDGTLEMIPAREIRNLDVYFRKQLDPIGDRGWRQRGHIFGSLVASKE